jgi:thiamine phosphate synthase YjbQ (UPF0047 family)
MPLTGTSEIMPPLGVRMAQGMWQGIFLFENRCATRFREIVIGIIGE